jgi:hypothetical protein
MGPVVSAVSVQQGVLVPSMDQVALNAEQQRLLFDPSPERDSLVELLLLGVEVDGAQPWEVSALRVCQRLGLANREEGQLARQVAGFADALASDLHGLELARKDGEERLGVRELVGRLRGPLDVLVRADAGEPVAAGEVAAAGAAIGRLAAVCPRERLLAQSIRHNLGGRRFRALERLVDGAR